MGTGHSKGGGGGGRGTGVKTLSHGVKVFDPSGVRKMRDYVGDASVSRQVDDYLNNHLFGNEQFARVDNIKILQPLPKSRYGEVDVEYGVTVAMLVGRDIETNAPVYEYDTEYRKRTVNVKLRKG